MPTLDATPGLSPEQAATIKGTQSFIDQYGASVRDILLEEMRQTYPNDKHTIAEEDNYWDWHLTIATQREKTEVHPAVLFHSQVGINSNKETGIYVYPIWSSYPMPFNPPTSVWDMGNLQKHLERLIREPKGSLTIHSGPEPTIGLPNSSSVRAFLSRHYANGPHFIHPSMSVHIQQKIQALVGGA